MGNTRTLAFASLAALGAMLGSLTALAADANLTGAWTLSIESPQGKRTPTMKLTQTGGAVTGTYTSQMGEVPVTGTVTGNEFKLDVKLSREGQEFTITYKGTVIGDAMTGMVAMGQMGDASFTGTRAKP